MSKQFKIVGNDLSDGFPFDELYEHRNLLFINFCLQNYGKCYWVRDHYEGWDLLVMVTHMGQISYHVQSRNRDIYEGKIREVEEKHHQFDGHTSSDVEFRLMKIASDFRVPI